jgi:hypothetical protein
MTKPSREAVRFGKAVRLPRVLAQERGGGRRWLMIERAARDFLNALGPDLRRRAIFPFEAEERLNWHYIPRERNGAVLKAMNDAQRQAA